MSYSLYHSNPLIDLCTDRINVFGPRHPFVWPLIPEKKRHSFFFQKKNAINWYHCTDFYSIFDELTLKRALYYMFFIAHFEQLPYLEQPQKNRKQI